MIPKHLFDPGSTLLRVMVDFFFVQAYISGIEESLPNDIELLEDIIKAHGKFDFCNIQPRF